MEDPSCVYTLEEALTIVGFGKFQGLVLAYAGLGWFAEATEIMILSFVGPAVESEWQLSSSEESLLTTVVFAGMVIGAYIWGLVSDNYGRRKGFLGVALVTSIGGLLTAFSQNYTSLLALRFLVGIGLGGGSVFSSWFLEFVPASNRGKWMVAFSTFWTLGTIVEAALAWIIMTKLNWRWLFAFSSVPAFVLLLFYVYAPESPRYLCLKGRKTDAHHILQKIALFNHAELPSGTLVSDRTTDVCEESNPSEDTHLLFATRNQTEEFKSVFSSFFILFSPKLIRTTLLLWVLYFGYSFSYYGVVLLTSVLSSGESKCGSIVLLSKNLKNASLYIDVFITSVAELPGLLLSAAIVDRVGRKLSMIIMFILTCIFLLPLVSHQSDYLTTGLLFLARICIFGTSIVACIYGPEVYPTSARATGAGVATAMGRIGGMICPLVAVELVSGCHQTAAIILLEVVMVVSVVSILFSPFETKGQGLGDSAAAFETKVAN